MHLKTLTQAPVLDWIPLTDLQLTPYTFVPQQLDNELDLLEKSWEGVKAGGLEQLHQRAVKEDDFSELRNLQSELKSRIHQCESVLDLSSSFHLASRQVSVSVNKVLCSVGVRHSISTSSPGGNRTV